MNVFQFYLRDALVPFKRENWEFSMAIDQDENF